MKSHIFIILFISLFFISCDNKAKESVREYLRENRIYDYTEREWGEVDSIFFPFETSKKYEQAYHIFKGDIFALELNLSKLNPKKDNKRIKEINDSIASIQEKINFATDKYNKIISEKKNNRESISLILTYKNNIGIDITSKFIFVFNENSYHVTHVIDEEGNLLNL